MSFEELYKNISPRLKMIARYHNGHGMFIDGSDLYQEMCMYLWSHYKDGMPEGVNESYVAKGCEFHVLNYLRKNREKVSRVSIDQPLNEEGQTAQDIIPCVSQPIEETADGDIMRDKVKNSGFNDKEKAVFFLLVEGRTAREIGSRLKMSHVMALKYKKKIIKRLRKR